MRGALVIALCATGCFSDRGVAIEVDVGPTGATSVELFIGKDACDSETAPEGVRCGGIAPIGATNLLPGNVWFRDAPSEETAPVKGPTVTFQLKSDTHIKLPIVIAVGFDRDRRPVGVATLRGLEIPTNSARVATTTLLQASSLSENTTDNRVKVWAAMMAPSSCVVVEHWQDGQLANRDFVVPPEDPDCDGLPNVNNHNECNANVYDSMYAGGQAPTPDCFGRDLQAGTCLLGSLACTDGVGPMPGTCLPQSPQHDQGPVCVPSQFCLNCPSLDPTCPQSQIDGLSSLVPRIECEVPTTPDGSRCPDNSSGLINLDLIYPPNTRCDQQPLLGSLQFAVLPTSQTHRFGEAEMELGSPRAPCSFDITWNGGVRTLMDNHGVIQLQTGNRSALLPIVFQFSSGCPSIPGPFMCIPKGNMTLTDPLWACAHQQ